jgi:hypothetical protein
MTKNDKIHTTKARVNTVLFATITGAEMQIVLINIFVVFWSYLFCCGIYAKTIIHLSVGE